ncbi:MAG: hypothetical protein J6Y08_07890 [Clostridiales bacterium]|nr:hypothetical protein [Clostridiales bacterium]
MKELDLNGITFMRPVPEGTDEWYFALDYEQGDLYEAQEIYEGTKSLRGNNLFLIHYPDAEVIRPIPKKENVAYGEPVYYDGKIAFVAVAFEEEKIRIHQFDCQSRELSVVDEIELSSIRDCFNLRLFQHPLTLTRQGNDGTLELIWPEKKTISIGEKESFFMLSDNKLYLNRWFEDPDYREETVVRDAKTGEILQVLPGDVRVMPNGEIWILK